MNQTYIKPAIIINLIIAAWVTLPDVVALWYFKLKTMLGPTVEVYAIRLQRIKK